MGEMKKHPDQPVELAEDGCYRFKVNRIVRFLLDDGPNDLNRLSRMPFSNEDWNQFAQLIGYSVSGFGDLPYSSAETVEKADAVVERMIAASRKAER